MKVNYKSVKGVLFFSLIFFGIFSHARWMNKKDASMKIEADTNISVKKDLSYSVTYDLKYHISTEQAKETLSIYTLRIIPDRQKFDLLKAQIILSDGKKVEVNREKIEFKDVSGAAKGFSSIKEIRIPLKQLQVGGQFHISYSIENFETQVENEFSFQYTFLTNGMHYLSERVRLKSEVPLYFSSENKYHWIKVKRNKKQNFWDLSLRKDRSLYLLDEFDVINSEQHFPIFVFSNFKNWNEFKHNYRKQILPRIDETLPKELSSFVEKLKKINNAKEKITKALSYIIHNYVYLGDWRPVRGSHIPRPLNEIVETKYGDCKDFSLLLTKILKEAGVEASMALIFRGTLPPYYSKIRQTPTLGAFNHMIVAVKNEDHFDYYDPTNMTVIVRSIAIDISQRYVLVLDEYSQNLFFTPKIDPEVNKLNLDIRIDEINFKSNLVDARAKYYINGPEAHYLLYSLLNNPLPVAEMRLRDRIFSGERIKDFKTLKFPKKQRILPKEGLEAIYSIEYTGPVIETTLGKGVIDVRSTGFARLPSPEDIKPDRINDLWLNVPLTNHRILRFPMNKIEGQLPEKCEAANSFFQRTREFTQTDNEILRMDTLVVTNPIVPNSILLSSKFIKDLEKADRCDDPVVLIPRK